MLALIRSSALRGAAVCCALLLGACDDSDDVPTLTLPAAGASGAGQGGSGLAGQAGSSGAQAGLGGAGGSGGLGGSAGSGGSAGGGGSAGQAGQGGQGGAGGSSGQGGSAGSGGSGSGQGGEGQAGDGGEGGCGPLGGDEGCAGSGPPEPAQLLYPTPLDLFSKAITPSCALNQGQCHNGWAAPDLTSFDALASLLGAPCQTGASSPYVVVNECEPPGDQLVFADGVVRTLLAAVVPDGQPEVPAQVVIYLDGPPGEGAMKLRQPGVSDRSMEAASLTDLGTNEALLLDLSALPGALANAWDVREWPRPPGSVHEADPNGDGIPGAPLGWREMLAGDPDRSFFYQRLLSDKLGSRMPLVQGLWAPEATRAIYCMILGQKGGPIVAEQPIDYDHCPPDLAITSGFAAVAGIVKNKCALLGCHIGSEPSGDLDLTPTPEQFAKVIAALSSQKEGAQLIKPGSHADSYLYCKVDPACERAPDTEMMPKDLAPLGPKELERLAEWIDQGAKLE